MGKGGVVLGILALLIGAGGLGFGVIAFINQNGFNIQINELDNRINDLTNESFWYDYKEAIYTPPDLVYVTVPDLYVIVELDTPSILHILFTTSTRILPDPVGFADMIFYFWIDGVRLLDPFTRAGPYEGSATYQYIPVALQHSQTFSAGIHNISIVVISETAGNLIRSSNIAVNRY